MKSIVEVKVELAEAQDQINEILTNLQESIDGQINLTEIRSHSMLFVILQVNYGAPEFKEPRPPVPDPHRR